MKVETIVNGYLEENCYIIHNDKYALIVDPGSEDDKVINTIDDLGLEVVGILITHYHFDHVDCLDSIKEKYNVDIYDNNSKPKNRVKCFNFEIIKNYGHTMDSVSFYFKKDKIMFTGDFVFRDTIGKYDLENESIMYESLSKFVTYDDDITIYPGHGMISTIGYEKRYNYFLRGI